MTELDVEIYDDELEDEELEEVDPEEESEIEILEPEEVQEADQVQEYDTPDFVPPTINEIVDQVIAGHWGSGQERRSRLWAAGYDHVAVQKELVRRMNHR